MIVNDSGFINQAMLLLEPVELDIVDLQDSMKKSKVSSTENSQSRFASMIGCQRLTENKLHLFAERFLLSANLMSTSNSRHGKSIIERFKLALDLHPNWEEAVFELGQYYIVLSDLHKKDTMNNSKNSGKLSTEQMNEICEDNKYLGYTANALDCYLKTISFGYKHVMQALPRLLTIWFTITGISSSTPR